MNSESQTGGTYTSGRALSWSFYSDSISAFCATDDLNILGALGEASEFTDVQEQRRAWVEEIALLKTVLAHHVGAVYFEYSIPRMGRRVDVVVLIGPIIFVLEFKVGERRYNREAIDQVFDYALDLKNFHETSHSPVVCPILIATDAKPLALRVEQTPHKDGVLYPLTCNSTNVGEGIRSVLDAFPGEPLDPEIWAKGRYRPTPTIIEAAMALYGSHSVMEISRHDAGAINLTVTSDTIAEIIKESETLRKKSIIFVTGVPGAGKTLVGLNTATKHINRKSELFSVFLSGNGPLVDILQEALARDKIRREQAGAKKGAKGRALSEVKLFVQKVHHFRDYCLIEKGKPPLDHVALFDEAQRAWTREKTADFMKRRKGIPNFHMSEPEFLISCLNRHKNWAVIVCLVGGGQEIHTGEAGIGEWIRALKKSYSNWHIHISSRLTDSEYGAKSIVDTLRGRKNVIFNDDLHLSVSMRSFRAENVSLFVKQVLDLEVASAKATFACLSKDYPIVLTRDIEKAKGWLKQKARGSERYGIVVSSYAERLQAHGMFVKAPMDPVHWFLDDKEDVRSSYYLEDVATEFSIQGLELDWTCVMWDADLRHTLCGWSHHNFVGSKWQNINKDERRQYQKNAYRVLLTRARQGMVICVPPGSDDDSTRKPSHYDSTFRYLEGIGIPTLG